MSTRTRQKSAADAPLPSQLTGHDLAAHARAHGELLLAQERAAHAKTRLELVRLATQHAQLLAKHNGEQQSAEADGLLKAAIADAERHRGAFDDLAGELRSRYALKTTDAICPLTGAIKPTGA